MRAGDDGCDDASYVRKASSASACMTRRDGCSACVLAFAIHMAPRRSDAVSGPEETGRRERGRYRRGRVASHSARPASPMASSSSDSGGGSAAGGASRAAPSALLAPSKGASQAGSARSAEKAICAVRGRIRPDTQRRRGRSGSNARAGTAGLLWARGLRNAAARTSITVKPYSSSSSWLSPAADGSARACALKTSGHDMPGIKRRPRAAGGAPDAPTRAACRATTQPRRRRRARRRAQARGRGRRVARPWARASAWPAVPTPPQRRRARRSGSPYRATCSAVPRPPRRRQTRRAKAVGWPRQTIFCRTKSCAPPLDISDGAATPAVARSLRGHVPRSRTPPAAAVQRPGALVSRRRIVAHLSALTQRHAVSDAGVQLRAAGRLGQVQRELHGRLLLRQLWPLRRPRPRSIFRAQARAASARASGAAAA